MTCDLSVAKYDAPEENSDVHNRNVLAASLLLFDTVVCNGFVGNAFCSENGVRFNPKVIRPIVL
jgi:hypothetical protein